MYVRSTDNRAELCMYMLVDNPNPNVVKLNSAVSYKWVFMFILFLNFFFIQNFVIYTRT